MFGYCSLDKLNRSCELLPSDVEACEAIDESTSVKLTEAFEEESLPLPFG
jgi:hypothetical protein